jgi:hypothetical protein
MRATWNVARVLVIGLLGLALASAGCRPTTRVLFIGNSYTYVNGGIDAQLMALDPSIRASRIASGGYTLAKHWNDGAALKAIRKGGWACVVLQEQSQTPILDPAGFRQYVAAFDQEIRRSGSRTILLMTWERPDSVAAGVTTANLAEAYRSVGADLGIAVAPAGLAFADARLERPDLALYSQDGHPTQYGTYLAACVVYATIMNRSPVGLTDRNSTLPPELRLFFQERAAHSLGK